MKILLLDDEQPALHLLETLLVECLNTSPEISSFTDPWDALEFAKQERPEIIFLDIEMPKMNGMDFAERILQLKLNSAIIFVTAYEKYAVEAFELNALDYILKPVQPNRLCMALERVMGRRQQGLEPSHDSKELRLQIACFGKFRISYLGEEIKMRTRKALELAAYLVHHNGNYVSKYDIIETLWEDFDGDRAMVHFYTTAHYLRAALFPYQKEPLIEHDQGAYRFRTDLVECDYTLFQSASHSDYLSLINFYKGRYLGANDYLWAHSKAQALEDRYMQGLCKFAQTLIREKQLKKAIEILQNGVELVPLNMELHRYLIEALIKDNNLESAKGYYNTYRKRLWKQTGSEPDSIFLEQFPGLLL